MSEKKVPTCYKCNSGWCQEHGVDEKKVLTVEELARHLMGVFYSSGVVNIPFTVGQQEKGVLKISEALLSFAAQESAPLVEAVEFYVTQQKRYGYKELKQALTAHRKKYGEKP